MKVTFNSKAGKVGFSMVQAMELLQEWGSTFPSEASRVSYRGSWLEGTAAYWYVTLYEAWPPELCTIRGFIQACTPVQ